MLKKIVLVGAVIALVAAWYGFGAGELFSLATLKQYRQHLVELYQANPMTVLAAYFVLYVLCAALSLPGATVLTLAGSAIFGFWAGLVTVSFASTLGAVLACAASRYLLRRAVRTRLSSVMDKIDRGLAGQGAWYLVSLRLVPVFPFFLVNLAMGLTTMPLRTFWWVSQLGMLPGTAVYVNAGTQLGRLETLRDAASPEVLVSLGLLAVFPVAAKWTLERLGYATRPR